MNNWEHTVSSPGEDFPMFELKYDWSRRFQFEFEWIELTIVDNKLGRNGQLAGDWEGKVGGRIRSSRQSQITKNFLQTFFTHQSKITHEELFQSQRRQSQTNHGSMVQLGPYTEELISQAFLDENTMVPVDVDGQICHFCSQVFVTRNM